MTIADERVYRESDNFRRTTQCYNLVAVTITTSNSPLQATKLNSHSSTNRNAAWPYVNLSLIHI